jgi:tetratricopeptide (TPR) repeat protein
VIGVLLTLALLIAWALALRRIWTRGDRGPESAGLLTLLAVAVIFGVQSLIDWTWFVPGVAVPAMLCAGWLAGRGPLAEPVGIAPMRRRILDAPGRLAVSLGIITVTALAAWMIWQPLRSANADSAAVTEASLGDTGAAIADANRSASINPLSIDGLSDLAAIYQGVGNLTAAHNALLRAVSRQPSNPATWTALAQFDLDHKRWLSEARHAATRARVLDLNSPAVAQLLAQATAG